MGTTFENINNYSTKGAAPSSKTGGSFSPYELLRKAKKLNLPWSVYRRAPGYIIEIFEHFYSYNSCTLPDSLRHRKGPCRKHDYQLVCEPPKDGVREIQENFLYFRMIKTWNDRTCQFVKGFANKVLWAGPIYRDINLPVNL